MAYTTPTFNYEQANSRLTQDKGFADTARNYGRFLSQERFRRSGEDMSQDFTKKFPKVGTHFNRRGMWNSGLRREGQQDFAQDYAKQRGRMRFDQAADNAGYDMGQGQADARFQADQLALMEQLAAARAAGYDPFEAVRGIV